MILFIVCAKNIYEYFIETFDILCVHLVDIFNAILDTGNFPVQWLEGILIPIHKKNNPKDVKNYRGITLVSCFSKIFTSVLNNRIMKWAEFGFRKNRSTIDAIFILNAIVNKVLNSKQRLYCAFIDLKAAFDNIYRNALWFKLHKCGINLKIVNIIKNVYTNVKSCVRHCNSYSSFLTVL